MKIIVRSKSLQKKFNISLIDYKEQYIFQTEKWNDIIEATTNKKEIEDLIKKLNIDTNSLRRIILNYYDNTFRDIDLFSPTFY